jgi:putative transposase
MAALFVGFIATVISRLAGTRGVASTHPSSVRTGKMGGVRGYDGGKHVKGRKRHTAVDTLGLPVAVSITAANIHDLHGGKQSLLRVSKFIGGRTLKKVYAEAYRAARFRHWIRETFDAVLRTAKNAAQKLKKFVPISQRWVVERFYTLKC